MNDSHAEALYRKHNMANGLAKVSYANDTMATQVLQIVINPQETRDYPVLYHYGFTASPVPGSDAAFSCLSGDRGRGYVVATGSQQYRMKGLLPGEVALYDNQSRNVYLSATGLKMTGGDGITMTTPTAKTTGNLKAGTGATGSFTSATGQTITVMDGIITNIF